MPGSAAELIIKLQGQDNVSGMLNNVQKSAHGLGSTMGTVVKAGALGAAAGIGVLAVAAINFVQAAAADEASQLKFQKALENTGKTWDEYGGKLDAAVTGAQKMAFTDDAARDSLSLLMAQTGDADEAMRRFTLAQDLSRGANIDLATASKLLGKVTAENANVLARYGITVTEGTTETELWGKLQEKFGGQAEVFAKNTAGQYEVAKIQMGELREKIGYALLPVMTNLMKFVVDKLIPGIEKLADFAIPKVKGAINDLLPILKEWWEKHGQAIIDSIKNIASSIASFLFPALDTLADLWSNLKPVLEEKVLPVLKKVGDFLLEHKEIIIAAAAYILLIINPWLAVVAALAIVLAKWDEISKMFTVTIPGAIDAFLDKIGEIPIIGEIFKGAFEAVKIIVMTNFDLIKNYIETTINVIRDIINIVTALIHGDWDAAWNGVKQLFTDIWDGIKTDLETKLGGIKDLLFNQLETMKGIVSDAVGLIRDSVTGAFQAVKDWVTEHWPEIAAIITLPFSPLVLLATDAFGIRSALVGAMDAVKTYVSDRIDDIVGFFTGLPGRITAAIGDLTYIGVAIVRGIGEGITSMAGWLAEQIGGVLDQIPGVAQIKGLLGKSPSPFGLELGQSLGEGIAVGLAGTVPSVLSRFSGTLMDRLAVIVSGYVAAMNSAMRFAAETLMSPEAAAAYFASIVAAYQIKTLGLPVIGGLASGGILTGTKPVLALLHPPEAVIPLGRGGAGPALRPPEVHIHLGERGIFLGERREFAALLEQLWPEIARRLT